MSDIERILTCAITLINYCKTKTIDAKCIQCVIKILYINQDNALKNVSEKAYNRVLLFNANDILPDNYDEVYEISKNFITEYNNNNHTKYKIAKTAVVYLTACVNKFI